MTNSATALAQADEALEGAARALKRGINAQRHALRDVRGAQEAARLGMSRRTVPANTQTEKGSQ